MKLVPVDIVNSEVSNFEMHVARGAIDMFLPNSIWPTELSVSQ